MNDGISKREFARREECSEGLVRRAVNQGRLTTYDDGTISPSLVGTAWRKGNVGEAEQPPDGAHTGAHTRVQVRTPVRTDHSAGEQPDDESLAAEAERLIESGAVVMLTYGQAVERKENYLALLRQLEYEEKSGQLVDLEVAERELFEASRSSRDAWLNWPARVGPLIAADLGLEADKVTEVLTAHVHKHVELLGEPDVQFANE